MAISQELAAKLKQLREFIRGYGSALVAFSGGVDSTFLAKIAHEELGDHMAAVTARSETYPEREYLEATEFAEQNGIRHIKIETEELSLEGFRNNPPDRCYYCKRELFGRLRALADELGLKEVLDGSNADDTSDYRPGSRAATELRVRSPLRDAGLSKADIRETSKLMGLPTWDKPSFACLSSRFPYGQSITPDAVKQVGAAEDVLREQGFRQLRVRHHGNTARIEVPAAEIGRFASNELRERIVVRLKQLGYTYVSLDLEGYRMGSMNEVL